MRALSIVLLSTVVIGTAASAAGRPATPPGKATADLRTALQAMVSTANQSNRKVDPDQGDDHASLRAIEVVCNHDNPSATRSAICPTPVSPE